MKGGRERKRKELECLRVPVTVVTNSFPEQFRESVLVSVTLSGGLKK